MEKPVTVAHLLQFHKLQSPKLSNTWEKIAQIYICKICRFLKLCAAPPAPQVQYKAANKPFQVPLCIMYHHLTQVAAHQSFENILCQCLVTPERDAFCHTWSYIFTLNLTSHTSHHIFIIIIHYRTFHVTIQYSIIIQFVSPPPSSSLIF